jgi:hypothetical protein
VAPCEPSSARRGSAWKSSRTCSENCHFTEHPKRDDTTRIGRRVILKRNTESDRPNSGGIALGSTSENVKTTKPTQKSATSDTPVSDMLTPSEIEQLRQEKKELIAFGQKAFAHLRPTK